MTGCIKEFVPTEQKTSILQITGYDNQNFSGTLEHIHFGEKQNFENVAQMLLLIEQLQDALNYPEKAMEVRRFQPTALQCRQSDAQPIPQSAVKATFKLRILFRQNASWQGELIWVEGGVEACFRSALEMIFLMDSVLQ